MELKLLPWAVSTMGVKQIKRFRFFVISFERLWVRFEKRNPEKIKTREPLPTRSEKILLNIFSIKTSHSKERFIEWRNFLTTPINLNSFLRKKNLKKTFFAFTPHPFLILFWHFPKWVSLTHHYTSPSLLSSVNERKIKLFFFLFPRLT